MSTQHRKAGGLRLPVAEVRLRNSLTHLPSGCQVRTTNLNQSGYSRMTVNGKQTLTHRLAWEIANGRPIPDGLVVMHMCDNPPCCNPEHLKLGTLAENNRDMFEKGRGCPLKGGSWKKIPPEAVPQILNRLRSGQTNTEIASDFGVTRQAIRYIAVREGLR